MSESAVIPVDRRQRQRVLDVSGSFIVQAPAGSGKTELLIQRILALLAVVNHPEEILAITFTRKAAAEMHKRLLEALEGALSDELPVAEHAAQTWHLARAAMARDRSREWNLLGNPTRLQVMTIDSFCATLVRRMPYLASFGESPAVAEDALDLYRAAAERLLARLERSGEGSAAIEHLLAHLDNQLPLLRDLLVAMLGRRDQWLRHLDPANLATARPELENALRLQIVTVLATLCSNLDSDLLTELCSLGSWAAGNLAGENDVNPLASLAGRSALPGTAVDDLPVWQALAHLVLTKEGEVRRSVSKLLGFPAGGESPAREMKNRILAALEQLGTNPAAVDGLLELRHLPAAVYTDEQWVTLAALIELLPLANQELRETFRANGRVDFAEIASGALAALGDDLAPADLLLHLDSRLRHVLVDEFQDTARGQFELLCRLTAGWEVDDGRTLFLVGDPMQSIYRFREAEVGLYLRVRTKGLENVRLEPLLLSANFRSQARLVDWFNATYAPLFPEGADEMRGAVPFVAAQAVCPPRPGPAVTLTCFEQRDDAGEAARIVDLIRQVQIDRPHGTVAVLVRSRTHLAALIPALKGAGIPWQAQEIDPLTSRPAMRDLLALTKALLHPADRIAWLSVLRAPWCGLSLDDLLALCGSDPEALVWESLVGHDDQPRLFVPVSSDGQSRLDRLVPVMTRALAGKGRVALRRLVETAWLGLNGPAGLAAGDMDDAGQFFTLLEELDEGGDLVRIEVLEERLGKLFAAPDPQAGPGLQLMTIHKAKGLEFDTVILPGLGRAVRPPERSLLIWQEQPRPMRKSGGLLLAPIPASSQDDLDPTYRAIARIHAEKERLETLRLFYVAATRARQDLHLFGHAERGLDGLLVPAAGSLLKAGWPVLSSLAAAGVVGATTGTEPASPPGVMLCRLPTDWMAPPITPAVSITVPGVRRASDVGHKVPGGLRLSLLTEEGRIIGTAVHGWLQRLAEDGVENWPDAKLPTIRSALREQLLGGGVPRLRVNACVERAMSAVTSTLHSRRGRWILATHQGASCEMALTGLLDGMLVHAIIDRTFVDAEGVRWVIDYKTSAPGEEESMAMFIDRERLQYSAQLVDYRRLLTLREPQREVRAALYFPLVDTWCEIG